MKSSAKGFTAQALALAAALGLSISGPHRAQAAPAHPVVQAECGPEITILNPAPQTSFSGVKPVEISAFYQGSSANQIVALELYVDGTKAAQKVLDNPETRGVVSFLVDASALTPGDHQIVVRATAADAEVTSAKTSFTFEVPAPAPTEDNAADTNSVPDDPMGPPRLSIENPAKDGSVQGSVKIKVKAVDPSGKAPYVSLFIDREWKSLRNYAPYEFTWDTTTYANGYHTLEAFGYTDDQTVGHSQALRVLVNNPGGRTERRTDLQDAPLAVASPAPVERPAAKALNNRRQVRAALIASRSQIAPLQAEVHRLQMVDIGALAQQNMELIGSSRLKAPFVDSLVPAGSQTASRVAHRAGLIRRSAASPAEMTMDGPAPLGVQPHHVRIVSFHVPDEALVSPSSLLPLRSLQPMREQAMTTVRSAGVGRPVVVAVPLAGRSQRTMVHVAHPSRTYSWLLAAGQSTVVFNSSWMTLQRPLAAQGSVLFGPLRQIFEADGGSLLWQSRTGVVEGHDKDRDVKLTIGRKSASINEASVTLDKAPYIREGRTMVPLSFLKAAMNVDVQYDPATGHLTITNKD